MNIIFLGGFPNTSRPDKNIFNLRAIKAVNEQVNVTVLTVRLWLPGRKLINETIYQGIRVIYFSIPHYSFKSPLLYWLNLRIVYGFLSNWLKMETCKFNLIHTASADYYGIIGGWLAQKLNIPHICQLIGSDINSHLPKVHHFIGFQNFSKNNAYLTANSQALIDSYENLFGPTPNKSVVYRGVDTSNFTYIKQTNRKELKFLFLGGLSPYKGIPNGKNIKGGLTLMKAWNKVDTSSDINHVKLGFGGPDIRLDEFAKWQSALRYPDQVEFLGLINPEEIKEIIAAYSIILIPSLEEGLPNLLFESMAIGRPVIGSNVGGIPEVIENGVSGVIIEPDNVDSLIDGMKIFIQKPDIIEQMGIDARDRIESLFDSQQFGRRYISIYKKCAE